MTSSTPPPPKPAPPPPRRPYHQTRQHIAAELVQTERVRPRRPRQPQRQLLRGRIVRDDPRPGNRRDDHYEDERAAKPSGHAYRILGSSQP
jgi:hypothetical protein